MEELEKSLLDPQVGWLVGIAVSLLVGAVCAIWKGAEVGLGTAVIVSCLFPVWLEQRVFGIDFNICTSVCILALLSYALRYPMRIISPLVPLDFAVALLVIVQTASDYFHGVGVISGLFAYGEWALPYVSGRYALKNNRTPEVLGWAICIVLVLLSVGAIVEMLTNQNVWELVFGERDGQSPRNATRYGFKRAFANTVHPIFYAMQLIMFLPWPMYLWRAEKRWALKLMSVGTIAIAFAGCLASVSRTPVISFVAVMLLSLAVKFVWARWLVGLSIVVMIAVIVQNPLATIRDAAEATGDKIRIIELDGKEVPNSSVLIRLWLLQVYWPALSEAGLLGFGSEATSTFPVNVPKLSDDKRIRRQFQWVDNAYILMGLRLGGLGVGALVLFFVVSVWMGLRLRQDRYWDVMAIGISSVFVTTAIVLTTVWLPYDFGFELLWMAGALAGISVDAKR